MVNFNDYLESITSLTLGNNSKIKLSLYSYFDSGYSEWIEEENTVLGYSYSITRINQNDRIDIIFDSFKKLRFFLKDLESGVEMQGLETYINKIEITFI